MSKIINEKEKQKEEILKEKIEGNSYLKHEWMKERS